MIWSPPQGASQLPDELGCWKTPDGCVYVHPDTWAQWTRVDPAAERAKERARQRWLQHNGFRRPSLEDLQMWNHYLHRCNEELAAEVARLRLVVLEYEPQALETT